MLNVAGCGDCHTTTGANGAPDRAKFLAGNAVPTAKGYQLAWNLTPDQKTGLGSWTAQQIATALHSGQRPNRGPVGGLMAEVVGVEGAKHLWVGEKYVKIVLGAIAEHLVPGMGPLPDEYDGPIERWSDL